MDKLKLKKLVYLSSTALLLAACGTGDEVDVDEDTIEETGNDTEIEEPETDENDTEDLEDDSENVESEDVEDSTDESGADDEEVTDESTEEETTEELSEEEAIERAREYAREEEDTDVDDLRFTVQDDEEGNYIVQIFQFAENEDGEETHTMTYGWYSVNRTTGEVTNRMEDTEPNVYISEIGSMTEENRNNHHRNIAVTPEGLEETILENLLLPGMHENTSEYQGRTNPGYNVQIDFSNAGVLVTEADEEGYFEFNLEEIEKAEGDTATILIHGESVEEQQAFELTIHEEHEGMEIIRVQE